MSDKNNSTVVPLPQPRTILDDINDGKNYPDLLPPDELDQGYKKLEQVKGRRKHAPKIIWGKTYQLWGDKKKVEFLEKFGNSMNHAADLLQNERNDLLAVVSKQEEQIKILQGQVQGGAGVLQAQLTRLNATAQERAGRVQELEAEVRKLKEEQGDGG